MSDAILDLTGSKEVTRLTGATNAEAAKRWLRERNGVVSVEFRSKWQRGVEEAYSARIVFADGVAITRRGQTAYEAAALLVLAVSEAGR